MRIWTQKSASIQKRTSPLKFDNFAEKSEKDTVSYLSTKAWGAPPPWGRLRLLAAGRRTQALAFSVTLEIFTEEVAALAEDASALENALEGEVPTFDCSNFFLILILM